LRALPPPRHMLICLSPEMSARPRAADAAGAVRPPVSYYHTGNNCSHTLPRNAGARECYARRGILFDEWAITRYVAATMRAMPRSGTSQAASLRRVVVITLCACALPTPRRCTNEAPPAVTRRYCRRAHTPCHKERYVLSRHYYFDTPITS